MQSDATMPSEFLDALDTDWRRDTLVLLREIIQAEASELDESMHYKMLGYGIDDEYVFHLNAQRRYVSLYVGDAAKVDPDGVLLVGLDVGKGCIRFHRTTSVADSRIAEFVARTMECRRQGIDVSC